MQAFHNRNAQNRQYFVLFWGLFQFCNEWTSILSVLLPYSEKAELDPGGGGTPFHVYKPYRCVAPKGMVFEPFWSEIGYRF